ncbi:hypothetical protein E4U21_001017 [Claviceps maximensis]|nr:hypothetical protein E4U21_001017 [Claviceps maximensis]
MASLLPIVEPKARPVGTPAYEQGRKSIVDEFAATVPRNLVLPEETIRNPPINVTGIARQCGLLSKAELDITENHDAAALADAIASRRFTSVDVVSAFAKRAIIAHQLSCCLTEWFLPEALEHAKKLDEHLASTGTTVGPLHGVPISVKAHIPIAGHWSDVGYINTRVKDDKDSQMIAILRQAGAVFYCKTNQPQSIMHLESTSFYGRTLNPHNINLSAGGSTGGEAALIALRGSVLGIGTDIGGSVRGPAASCGIYGFKPTSYTLPTKDFFPSGGTPAEMNVICATGPMCTTLRDMDLFTRVIVAAKPWIEDPRIIPIPWTGTSTPPASGVLKIGMMMHDEVIVPQPPVTRALAWAKTQLQNAGCQVKPFKPYKVSQIMSNIRQAYWPATTAFMDDLLALSGEPKHPLTEWITQDAPSEELRATGVFQQRTLRDKMRTDFSLAWDEQDVDFVLCPAFVGPASSHDTARHWNYTALWNYLDCPAVVVPTPIRALAKGSKQDEYEVKEPLSRECAEVRKLWEEGDFEGAPINVQFVARRYHDNELFAMLFAMKQALHLA